MKFLIWRVFHAFLFIYLFVFRSQPKFPLPSPLLVPPLKPTLPLPTGIHSSSSVSLQKRVGLQCMSTSHVISSCSETRHLSSYQDWMQEFGSRNGSQKPITESKTACAPTVWGPIWRWSYTTLTNMQRASVSLTWALWFLVQYLWTPISPGYLVL